METKVDIKSLTLEELTQEIQTLGEKPFRAGQLFSWMHEKLASGFEEMTNLSKAFREKLQEKYEYTTLKIVEVQVSQIDGTCKFLFELQDGLVIESVLMKYKHGNSVCISSQAGCRMGCRFCASTIGGLDRSLKASEMLEQIYRIQQWSGERVSNIVVMGSGEPLENYDNLLRFIHLISYEKGLHISQRNITVSTCGIVPNMLRLAEENLQITLALSLHAATQEKRQELMPIARKYQLDQVVDACRVYFEKTGRRITFEYSLVGGVNDTAEDAAQLHDLIGKLNCHVNLIPVNPVTERTFVQPDKRVVDGFKRKLEGYGIQVTVRREMGRDIDGACGQLRRRYMNRETPVKDPA